MAITFFFLCKIRDRYSSGTHTLTPVSPPAMGSCWSHSKKEIVPVEAVKIKREELYTRIGNSSKHWGVIAFKKDWKLGLKAMEMTCVIPPGGCVQCRNQIYISILPDLILYFLTVVSCVRS